jgi:hypothetical protein
MLPIIHQKSEVEKGSGPLAVVRDEKRVVRDE